MSSWPVPTVVIDVDEEGPASRKEAESARTMHAELGGTEPMFRGDARQAVDALLKQCRHLQEMYYELKDDPFAHRKLGSHVRAIAGVRALAERLLGPREHHLKTDPEPFRMVTTGLKTYEIRKFDRDYRVGDVLVLQEFDRKTSRYSGQKARFRVTTITQPGLYGLPDNLGVLGIEPVA